MKKTSQAIWQKWLSKDRWFKHLSGLAVGLIGLSLVSAGFTGWWYKDKVWPQVQAGQVNLSGLTIDQAEKVLEDYYWSLGLDGRIDLVLDDGGNLGFATGQVDLKYDSVAGAEAAFGVGRGGDLIERVGALWQVLINGVVIDHPASWSEELFDEQIDLVAQEVNQEGVEAQIELVGDVLEVYPGLDGWVVDTDKLKEDLTQKFRTGRLDFVELPTTFEQFAINDRQAAEAKLRALMLLEAEVEVAFEDDFDGNQWLLEAETLVGFVDPRGGYNESLVADFVESLAIGVNREAVDASFKFEDGRVIEFAPSKDGVVVDESASALRLLESLGQLEEATGEAKVELVAKRIGPGLETPDVTDLGIETLIGRGSSAYKGSIPGRVHNVALTATRLHGILVPPGEVFSFNGTIGDVSRATGYKTAYVIQNGRTVLGDGGGVCQDSTTLFRAVLDAGLPIIERKGHSYRVGYYEQNSEPGFDATVYSPTVDLKFKNDTSAHILIQAIADTANSGLVIELYGADDGRVAEIENYQIWDRVPAPPPLYQDDPTLAPGVIKQVDWAASGVKTKFDYVVTKNGEEIRETFYTNYRPWQAVYLRGI